MRTAILAIIYAAAVIGISLLAFGLWGIAAAALLIAFWGLWRQREPLVRALGVLVLLVLMAGVVLGPLIVLAREAAFTANCSGRMFYLGHALRNYHEAEGGLPPLQYDPTGTGHSHNWRVALLPYLDYDEVYNEYHFDQPWDAPLNRDKFAQRYHELFFCPVHNQQGSGCYLAVAGAETAWGDGEVHTLAHVTDDPAATILLLESSRTHRAWNDPRDLTFDEAVELLTSSFPEHEQNAHYTRRSLVHKVGYRRNVIMCDGSYHTLSVPLDRETAVALLTSSGGESVDVESLRHAGPAELDWQRIAGLVAFVVVALVPLGKSPRLR